MLDVAFETPYRQPLAAREVPDSFRVHPPTAASWFRVHPTDSQFWVLTRKGARNLDNLKRPCFPKLCRGGPVQNPMYPIWTSDGCQAQLQGGGNNCDNGMRR